MAIKKKKGTRTGIEMYNQISMPTNILLSLIVFIWAMLCLLPVLLVVSISFASEASVKANGYQFFPSELTLDAYNVIFGADSRIPRSLLVSIIITLVGTSVGVLIQAAYGYVLSQKSYYLTRAAHIFILIPMLFGGGLIPSYMINTGVLGFKDSIFALILPGMVGTANIIIMRTYFKRQLSQSILEQAEIDGSNELRTFFTIVLPLSLPVLATIAIFMAFGYWNGWMEAKLYIKKPELKPLQALLMDIQGSINFMLSEEGQKQATLLNIEIPRDGIRMALVVVIVVPIALVYPFFQRYFVSGLTIGAVKG